VSFEFENPGRPIEDSVRAAAKAEFDRAIGEVAETGFEIHETVRTVRRRLKRIRAIVRLIRPAFAHYRAENELLRSIGADVSALRDAAALVDGVDRLLREADGETAAVLHQLRRRLVDAAADEDAGLDRDAFLLELRGKLREARVRAELWELTADDAAAVVPGFVATYRKSRGGYRAARKHPTEERYLHEWRKAVKFHWAQLSLLRGFAPAFAEKRRAAAKRLAESLGDHHNLCVLRDALTAQEADKVGPVLEAAIERLGKRALKLGRPLFAETPRQVRSRWTAVFADRAAVGRIAHGR